MKKILCTILMLALIITQNISVAAVSGDGILYATPSSTDDNAVNEGDANSAKRFSDGICGATVVTAPQAVSSSVSQNAADAVKRGTPIIDGVLDEMYKGSLTIVYDNDVYKNASATSWWDAKGNFYALYDDNYVYLAAEVKDNDVVSVSDSYLFESVNPYGNDCVEFRLDLGGGTPTGTKSYFKIGIDAYGKILYTLQANIVDIYSCMWAVSHTSDGYIIEAAIPHGTTNVNNLISSGKLGLKVWLFDLHGNYAGIENPVDGVHFMHYTRSINGEGAGDRAFYDLSDEYAVDCIAKGECGDALEWKLSGEGELSIIGTGEMWDYSNTMDVPWYNNRTQVKSITISDTVTSISANAFFGCSNVESVVVPSSVKKIGASAFDSCRGLRNVEISNGVEYIGDSAFYSCVSLSSVKIPASVTHIGKQVFRSCTSLGFIEVDAANACYSNDEYGALFDKNKTTLIQYPLASSLVSYAVPGGVENIDPYSFMECARLASVELPQSVKSVGVYAFYKCASLGNAKVYSVDAQYGAHAFSRTGSDFVIQGYLGSSIETYAAENGISFVALSNVIQSGECGDGVTWTLNASGELIISGRGEMLNLWTTASPAPWYEYRERIKNVTVENSVANIGAYAFYNCENLKSVNIADSVTEIGAGAFYNCAVLTDVQIPSRVEAIGEYAFYGCESLASIIIPEGVSSIGDCVFNGCALLKKATVYSSAASFGIDVFENTHADLTLYGYGDSTTKTYADANSHRFVQLDIPSEQTVKYGTSVVDGALDDIYESSLTIVYDSAIYPNANLNGWWDASGRFYALYDDEYVYLAAVVQDDDVVSAADTYVLNNANPYGNDCVEFRLDLGGGSASGTESFFKIGIDAYGKRIYSPLGISCDLDACTYATRLTDDGYIIEVAIPHSTREGDMLLEAETLGLKVWLFDLHGNYEGVLSPVDGVHFKHYARSIVDEGMGDRVFYELDAKTEYVTPEIRTPAGVAVNAPVHGWTIGENTFSVSADIPCAVLVTNDGGATYTRLTATKNAGGTYSFTAELTKDSDISVVIKGDANGDGRFTNADITKLKAANIGKTALGALAYYAVDVNGDGKLTNADVTRTKAAFAGKIKLGW